MLTNCFREEKAKLAKKARNKKIGRGVAIGIATVVGGAVIGLCIDVAFTFGTQANVLLRLVLCKSLVILLYSHCRIVIGSSSSRISIWIIFLLFRHFICVIFLTMCHSRS